jgi:glycosyltransferase involved in cell wall biosynthesis
LGWTYSDQPRADVAINYYLPYLKFDARAHPAQTQSAAWFTHYESGTEWKVAAWREAARLIDLPLITSPVYANMLPNALFVAPGVDADLFQPRADVKRHHGRIGTAGVGQPRKGPHLLVDLFYSGLGAELAIAGEAWPFPCTGIAHEDMPAFYSSLGVYLCTSLEEGVPEPVLEALACDTKVVIPHGVGIGDLLPSVAGIRHYQKGNAGDMLRALRLALADRPAPGALRQIATDNYAVTDWVESHREAFNAILPV